jgi:hypothetical protein
VAIHRDYILRMIEEAGVALRRLLARLTGRTAPPDEIAADAERAQAALLGPLWDTARLLDALGAAALVREPAQLALWAELMRVEAGARRAAGDAAAADALERRAEALARASEDPA